MFFKAMVTTFIAGTFALPAVAEPRNSSEAMRIAKQSHICGDLNIVHAEWRRHGNIGGQCEGAAPVPLIDMGEATNFVPLIGGLGPLLGLGLSGGAVVVGALGGGSSTSDTQ